MLTWCTYLNVLYRIILCVRPAGEMTSQCKTASHWLVACTGWSLWADLVWGRRLAGVGGPIVELRRSCHRLISTMRFPALVRLRLYIASGLWLYVQLYDSPLIDCELYMPMTNSWLDIFYVSVPVFALTWMNKKKKIESYPLDAGFNKLIQVMCKCNWWRLIR